MTPDPPAPLPVVGIVGGIGSGKSAVARILQQRGGHLIAADQLGHEALLQPEIQTRLVERWGQDILNAQGRPDRHKIGRIVFADPLERRALELIVFPYIEQRILEECDRARRRADVKFVILDAAILLEAGWHRFCWKVVFVAAPREVRLARLQQQRGWSAEELTRREQAQMPLEEKQRRADLVLINDEGLDKLSRQVQESLERWNIIC